MLSMDTAGVVVHASSFTKTVCPGVRVGYLVGPEQLIAEIAKRATNLYISPGMVAQAIVHQFCVNGDLDRSIATVCTALGERARVLAEALRRHIPEASFVEPDGGYFLWVDLPEWVSVAKLAPAAAERGVAVVKGSDFVTEGGEHSLRLAYSAVTVDQIDEGVRRIAAAMESIRDDRAPVFRHRRGQGGSRPARVGFPARSRRLRPHRTLRLGGSARVRPSGSAAPPAPALRLVASRSAPAGRCDRPSGGVTCSQINGEGVCHGRTR